MNASVVPIVEGHGEQGSIRTLLQRIWVEELGHTDIEVLRPIRQPKSLLMKREGFQRTVELAARKLAAASHEKRVILLMIDANGDDPPTVRSSLDGRFDEFRPDISRVISIPSPEFETWFVGGAESLTDWLDISNGVPDSPETAGCGKGWIQARYRGHYSETIDQPRLTAAVELALVRRRCPSFDALCRDLRVVGAADSSYQS